jgi:hypothetical protein
MHSDISYVHAATTELAYQQAQATMLVRATTRTSRQHLLPVVSPSALQSIQWTKLQIEADYHYQIARCFDPIMHTANRCKQA